MGVKDAHENGSTACTQKVVLGLSHMTRQLKVETSLIFFRLEESSGP